MSRRTPPKSSSLPSAKKRSTPSKKKVPAIKAAQQKIHKLEEELERAKKVTIDVLDAEIGRSKKIAGEVREQLKKIQEDRS